MRILRAGFWLIKFYARPRVGPGPQAAWQRCQRCRPVGVRNGYAINMACTTTSRLSALYKENRGPPRSGGKPRAHGTSPQYRKCTHMYNVMYYTVQY